MGFIRSPRIALAFLAFGLLVAAAQSVTRYEQALKETRELSADLKAIWQAARLRDVAPPDADVDDGDADDTRRQLKDARKSLGLTPPPLNSGPSMADVNGTFFRFESVTASAVVDWRQTMFISPIQRQFLCASCWAIAAVDSISMMWAITTSSLPAVLSPQQVCDCGTKQCCQGGWPDWAFSYVLFNGGITAVDSYPYLASDSAVCLANSSTPTTAQITGWELVPPYSAVALMKAVSMQPVVAFLSGSAQDFQRYNSRGQLKIYDGLCSTDINHVVVVVGYNYTGQSLAGSYWILKNSWFSTWGDGGYMYLAMSPDVRGKCGIHAIPAMYPVFYPSGPQPVRVSNGPITRADDGNDGRWWTKAYPALADACSGINPCGSGRCYTRAGMARCDCSALVGMVEVQGVPTSKCVPKNPCSTRGPYNPCGSGTCVNPGDGSYTCQCPAGYAIGAASDGTQTCVGVASTTTTAVAYPTVPGDSCSSVAAAFGLTTAALAALNPFLNCSLAFIPPAFILSVANASSLASLSTPLCTATYSVQPSDTCSSLAATFFAGSLSALRAANPLTCTTARFYVLPAQTICTALASASSPSPAVPQCGQTYVAVAGDTCSSVATKFAVSLSAFAALNAGLSCWGALPVGSYVCVAPKSAQTVVNCTAWYTVLQGDNCPNIWNAANLTEATFLAINPGIRCQAPYLLVGQKVCINSPLLATLLTASNTSYSLYTVQPGDSLALISSKFVTRCTASSVAPASIAAANNILETAPLTAGASLIIPCDTRVGILDCGCAASLPVCGADYVTYPSYCDALCNYALPVIQSDVCSGCNAACTGRTGLAPAAGYNCTLAVCPYPLWQPLDSDCTVLQGDAAGRCCAVEQTVCDNVCTATKNTLGGTSTQMQTNYNSCYSQCMCCSRVPCATSTCSAPSSCWSASPRKCIYSNYKYTWNCTWFPPASPLP
ncbi:hypothetical protein CLOM_g2595 [Closterium sp. NIES-68]|nr:hypothetical protein CLOM_g2595 [Closterium sp. NIES-68]GJP81065.1 hypothetical protein CLOP_g11245 [Closterium sp. NIES-67]